MNATVRKLAIPDTTEFSSLLNTVDLVTRAKLMHQLQVVVFPSGIGAKRYYFCMDGVHSPLFVATERLRKEEVAPYRLVCEIFRKTFQQILACPMFIELLELPAGFMLEGDTLCCDKSTVLEVEQAKSAHQVCAYLLLNDDARVSFDLGAKTAFKGVNCHVSFVREKDSILLSYTLNGLHDNQEQIQLSGIDDYKKLFNAVMMAFGETTY